MRRARLGLRRSHLVPASGGAVFDPATLSLTGWWRAAYAGSPWAPTASAGTSGTANRDLGVDSGAATPSVGTALNGLDTADFDGSTQSMADGDSTLDTYVSAAAYERVCGMARRRHLQLNAVGRVFGRRMAPRRLEADRRQPEDPRRQWRVEQRRKRKHHRRRTHGRPAHRPQLVEHAHVDAARGADARGHGHR
jgi:hypothetical protein